MSATSNITKEGSLEVSESFMFISSLESWQKRWAVLRSYPNDNHYYLYTYAKEKEYTNPTNSIKIDASTEIEEMNDTEEPKFYIENKKVQEKFKFRPHSTQDRTDWISCLQSVILQLSSPISIKQIPDNEKTKAYKAWFQDMNLLQYYQTFVDCGYEDLSYLANSDWEDADLQDLNIEKEPHRKKLLREISALKSRPAQENIGVTEDVNKDDSDTDKEDEEEQYIPDIPESISSTSSSEEYEEMKEDLQHIDHQHGPKKEVSLLFVGETGVGKTTLLQSLNDFINHVPYEEVKVTKKSESVGLSQTQNTEQFPLSNEEWAVNIIDTPGIGDTSGIDKDAQHMDSIIDFIGDYGDFNAVCILIKRGTTRITTRMRYIVNEIKSNMPKDVQSNFIVIMTRADVPVPDSDTMAVIKELDLPTGNIISVNNGAYEELDLTKYQKGSPIVKIVKQRQKRDYASNQEYLQILLETAHEMRPYQGHKMKQLKEKRDKLKEQVGILRKTIDTSFDTEKEIKKQISGLEAASTIEQMNKAYDQSGSHIEYEWYKKTGSITTHCNVCSNDCHMDCRLSYGTELTRCWASGTNGKCTQCGCSMNNHCHMGWEAKKKTVWIENVNEEMKVQYMDAKQKKEAIEKRKIQLQANLTQLEKTRDKCAKDIQRKYAELEKIAIIGYNESFELYMQECKKAIDRDGKLTKEEKKLKIAIFDNALENFKVFMQAIGGM